MVNRKSKMLMWFLALAVVMACVPTLSSAPPAVSTLDPNTINQIIAQTAIAASTQTALAIPTSTPTETYTPTATGTKTPTPTITETFIFIYNSPTPFVVQLATATFKPTSNKNYACEIIESPKNNEIYDPRVEFKVKWRVRNVGKKAWERAEIDFAYVSGDKFHRVDGYDLSRTTLIGEVADLFVDMRAPKDPGTYTTHWSVFHGTEEFCKLKLTINVK